MNRKAKRIKLIENLIELENRFKDSSNSWDNRVSMFLVWYEAGYLANLEKFVERLEDDVHNLLMSRYKKEGQLEASMFSSQEQKLIMQSLNSVG